MPIILDERQIKRLEASKRRRRRGRAIKASKKQERLMRKRMSALWDEVLRPTAERLKQMARDGAPATEMAEFIDSATNQAEFFYGVNTEDLITQWEMGVDKESRQALRQALSRTLEVDVTALVDDPAIADTMRLRSKQAADLIVSIPSDYLEQVNRAVLDNHAGIPFPDDRSLLQEIMHIGKVSKKRATLIARDQTQKLSASIDKTRQEEIGIKMYVWRTAEDQRVVGNPSGLFPKGNSRHGDHYAMSKVYCSWSDNTVYSKDKGNTWLKRKPEMPKTIPGWDIQCRCYASPVIDLDEILANATPL